MVKTAPDYHADAVIEVDDYQGTPVLIHAGGRYPSLVDDDGRKIDHYIDIAQFHDGYHVRACAGSHHGYEVSLSVGRAETIAAAKNLYPIARAAVEDAPHQHAEARALAAKLAFGPLLRHEYEALAVEYGFEVQPDGDLSEWGDFSFPQYALADLPRRWCNQRRAFSYKREIEAAREARTDGATIVALRSCPVARTETKFLPGRVPVEWLQRGALYTVVKRAPRRISEDDPSIYGSHLLGHEGETGSLVTVEIRTSP
jgi:hypothetical protein